MSEYERVKYYGKKKYNNAQRNDQSKQGGYARNYFNKTVYNPDKDTKEPAEQENKTKIKQPQILIKTREKTEERSLSPKRSGRDESSTSASAHSKESNVAESVSSTNVRSMHKSQKLIDEGIICNENVQDYLSESSDFLVVGVIGPQGVGKSTILNLLASDVNVHKMMKEDEIDDDGLKSLSDNMYKLSTDDASGGGNDRIFREESTDDVESCVSATSGVDLYITENRIILLDSQPFLSPWMFDELIRGELKRSNTLTEFSMAENVADLQGLQNIAFMMSVCHILIFVQDRFFDSNNIKFVLTAEMLRPSICSNDEEYVENNPHLLLIHNRARMDDFSPMKFKIYQQIYKQMFSTSKLHLESSMGLGMGKIMQSLNAENCGDPINLFLLPENDDNSETTYRGHPKFEELVRRLRMNVSGVTKYPITNVQLTERTWLTYCGKVWDYVKKSTYYIEYTKLVN